jgi:magnesium-transporting ATPase (P-type)
VEALVVIGAIVLGMTLPVTALQILWINLVTEVALGLTLAFEPTDPKTMTRKPRPPSAPLLDGPLVWQVVWVSLLMAAATFGVFMLAQSRGAPLDVARTMAVNTVVVTEIFYLFSIRRLTGTGRSLVDMLSTRITFAGVGTLIVLQLAFTYAAPLNGLFHTAPLSLSEWGVVLGAGVGFLGLVEAEMAVRRRLLRSAPG